MKTTSPALSTCATCGASSSFCSGHHSVHCHLVRRNCRRAGRRIGGEGFLHIHISLIGSTTTLLLSLFYAAAFIVPVVQILTVQVQCVSSLTIRPTTTVRSFNPNPSNSILGRSSYPYSYHYGLTKTNQNIPSSTAAATAARTSSTTCLILKRSRDDDDDEPSLLLKKTRDRSSSSSRTGMGSGSGSGTGVTTSTSLNASRLRNSHDDYLYSDNNSDSNSDGDGSSDTNGDQMARRRRRRSRERQEETGTNDGAGAEAPGTKRRSRRKRQDMYDYDYRNGAPPSSGKIYDGSVESVMKRRRYRQSRNDNNNSNWDNVIMSNTVDLSVQAMNGVKYVAKRTASTSKTILNDLGSEINKRLVDDDDYDYYRKDDNGVQEADWYYVSKDTKNKNNNDDWVNYQDNQDNAGGWVRKNKKKRRYKSKSPSSSSSSPSSYSPSRQNYYSSQQDRKRRRERPKYKAEVPTQRVKEPEQQRQQRVPSPSDKSNEFITIDSSEQRKPLLLPPKSETNAYFPPLNNEESLNINSNGRGERVKNEDRSMSEQLPDSEISNVDQVDEKDNIRNNENKRAQNSPRQRRRRGNSRNENKKVYSVYPQDNDEVVGDMQDLYGKVAANAIDSVGNMMVDVVEGKYWNNTDSSSNSSGKRSGEAKFDPDNRSFNSSSQRRHWRDRLTEKVDYALGVHEDGNYYKKWQDKINDERMSETGNDPVSIFYGRQKREHGPKRNVSFWEENGSLMSLFFGRTPNGDKLSFDRASSANICTFAFKVSFQYSIAILSQLCRWVSCRGSLPQPIVVFFVAASALSAPRRRRLVTVGITIIALRTLAEALHGYVHDGWEEDIRENPSNDGVRRRNDPSKQAESNNEN